MSRDEIINAIYKERNYQNEKWGLDFDNKNTPNDWASYLLRYTAKACDFNMTNENFQSAMIKVASIAVAAIEALDRTETLPKRHYD